MMITIIMIQDRNFPGGLGLKKIGDRFRVDSKIADQLIDQCFAIIPKPENEKRTRGPKGKFKGDDKETKHVDEAWESGKAPGSK